MRFLISKTRGLSDEMIHSLGLDIPTKYSNDLYQYLKKQGLS